MTSDKDLKNNSKLTTRPPVVTVMGHVDHGKTSLLSAIKETDLTRKEFGGISQHLGAYQIKLKVKRPASGDSKNLEKLKVAEGKTITFIDTPGHVAFSQMRARGAKVTDIVVLVVAADEGVKPQTKEALAHARAAGVPIIVAINKIDLPHADVEKTKKDLILLGLTPEEWGGDTVTVEVSAKTKKGLDDLLEMILLVAEMQELRVDPSALFRGVVVESSLDARRGPVATVLIKEGTLHLGDEVVSESALGKIRALIDDHGKRIKAAAPSTPVEILGLNDVPAVGAEIADISIPDRRGVPAERLDQRDRRVVESKEGVKNLNVILKSDVEGTLEAIQSALKKLETDRQKINIIHAATGEINKSDVLLAQAGPGMVLGFNVRAAPDIRHLAATANVEIRLYHIIYELLEDAEKVLRGLAGKPKEHPLKSTAVIIKLFALPHSGKIITGARVLFGTIGVGDKIHFVRDGEVVHRGRVQSIGVGSEHKQKVSVGTEAGLMIKPQFEFRIGDKLEAR